jgi:hypothetical protein
MVIRTLQAFVFGMVMFFVGLVRGIGYLCLGLVTWALGFVCLMSLIVAVVCFIGAAMTHGTQFLTGLGFLGYSAVAFALIVALHSMRATPVQDVSFSE